MDSLLIGVLLAASLAVLVISCPSRAKLWAAVKDFAADHEAANRLMDERRQARRDMATVHRLATQPTESCGDPVRGPVPGERKGRLFG